MTPSGPYSLGGRRQRRGMCPVCSRDVPVTRDGMVSKVGHVDQVTRQRCAGLGHPALPLTQGGGS